MPKTGKERKARRRARQAAEAARASHTAPGGATDATSVKASPLTLEEPGGQQAAYEAAQADLIEAAGDHWDSAGRGDIEQRNQRLARRSLRWLTDADGNTFEGRDPRTLKAKEIAILQTRKAMLSPNIEIAVGLGVKTLLQLERQNQVDELAYDPFKSPTAPGSSDPAAPTAVQVVINMPSNGRGPAE